MVCVLSKSSSVLVLCLMCALAHAEGVGDVGGYIAVGYKHSENNMHYNSNSLTDMSVVGVSFSYQANAYVDIAGHVRTDVDDVEKHEYQVPYFTVDVHTDMFDTASMGLRAGLMRFHYGLWSEIRVDPYNTVMNDIPSALYAKTYDVLATGNRAAEFYIKAAFDEWIYLMSIQYINDLKLTDEETTANILASFVTALNYPSTFRAEGMKIFNMGFYNEKITLNFSRLYQDFSFYKVGGTDYDIVLGGYFDAYSFKYFTDHDLYFIVEHLFVGGGRYLGRHIEGYKALTVAAIYDRSDWKMFGAYSHGWFPNPEDGGEYLEFSGLDSRFTYIHEYIIGAEKRLPTKERIKVRGEVHYNKGFFSGDYSQNTDLAAIEKYWGFASVALIWAF